MSELYSCAAFLAHRCAEWDHAEAFLPCYLAWSRVYAVYLWRNYYTYIVVRYYTAKQLLLFYRNSLAKLLILWLSELGDVSERKRCWHQWEFAKMQSQYFLYFFTAQCTLVHMRGLGIACRLVCLSVCNVGEQWSHRLEILETNYTDNYTTQLKLKLYYEMWQTHTKHWKFSENDSAEKHKKTRKHVNTNILAN